MITIDRRKLSERAQEKARSIKNEVDKRFNLINKIPTKWDYVSVVIACQSNRKTRIEYGCTGALYKPYVAAVLRQELENKLGPIGGKSPFKGCSCIGHCAEPHAANKLLKQQPLISSTDDLYFSVALRPRTGNVVPTCSNCLTIFKNV